MTDTSHAIDTHADAKPAQAAPVHESQLFALGQGPRLFGEGSYSTGGSPSEGNYASPDINPQRGYGSFDDAGGYGATQLLGAKSPEASPTEEPVEETEESSE